MQFDLEMKVCLVRKCSYFSSPSDKCAFSSGRADRAACGGRDAHLDHALVAVRLLGRDRRLPRLLRPPQLRGRPHPHHAREDTAV